MQSLWSCRRFPSDQILQRFASGGCPQEVFDDLRVAEAEQDYRVRA
jgi:hypothetical protein